MCFVGCLSLSLTKFEIFSEIRKVNFMSRKSAFENMGTGFSSLEIF